MLAFIAAALLAVQTPGPAPAAPPAPPRAVELMMAGQAADPEFETARAALLADAQAGNAAAMRWMGVLAASGAVEADAETWFRRAMNAGDGDERARAAFALAGYLAGRSDGAAQSRALLEGIEEAPEDIRADVIGYLGADYLFGFGGEVRAEQGRALLNSAIAQGFEDPAVLDSYGGYMLGVDRLRAMELWARAANAGSANAAWRYAMAMLENGGDAAQAYEYVSWAAARGHLQARISKAVMLATGQGVETDAAAARQAYESAALDGSAHALRGLGVLYAQGEGGPADAATGYALLALAAEAGDEVASRLLADPPDTFEARPPAAAVEAAGAAWLEANALSAATFQ